MIAFSGIRATLAELCNIVSNYRLVQGLRESWPGGYVRGLSSSCFAHLQSSSSAVDVVDPSDHVTSVLDISSSNYITDNQHR